MLVDSEVVFGSQGVDPVIVKLPFDSVPIKSKVMGTREFVIVPVNAVPVCDMEIWPRAAAARVVAPLAPNPCPD
jgi:hypothetical protein